MSELLKTFDSYNDFNREPFFTLKFEEIASEIYLEVPLVSSKENMDKLLDFMNLKANNYELVYKIWKTEDSNNSDFSNDYPRKMLFLSNKKKSIIWIDLSSVTLYIEFLYDCKDLALEKWILEFNHSIRKKYGLTKSPTFKVLTKGGSDFETEDVRTEEVKIDIESNYNKDFEEIHDKIRNSITSKKSGLILLYGDSGTGKTTYIKNLISSFNDFNFIFIQNEFVNNLLEPAFISFLLRQRNSILVIEDAEKVLTTRENLKVDSVVSTILQLTDGLFSDYLNIKIICTFNTNLSKIDKALLRKGRLLVMYEFMPLELEKTNKLLEKLGYGNSDKELSIADIYNYEEKEFNNLKTKKIGF